MRVILIWLVCLSIIVGSLIVFEIRSFSKTENEVNNIRIYNEARINFLDEKLIEHAKQIQKSEEIISILKKQAEELIKSKETWVSLGIFTLTAYCPCSKCCGKWANGITATGTKATEGRTIAVDPKKIPYGSKVKINGHIYTAEDCGGAIKNNKIDVYFSSHSKALQFGRKKAEVFILKAGG